MSFCKVRCCAVPLIIPDADARQRRGIHNPLLNQVIEELKQIEPGQTFGIAVNLIRGRKFEVFRALVQRAAKQVGMTPPAISYDKNRDMLLVQKLA